MSLKSQTFEPIDDQEVVFYLSDGGTDFNVSLGTMIQCLQVAEQLADVPGLPHEWKDNIPKALTVIVESIDAGEIKNG